MGASSAVENIGHATVRGFGEAWIAFDQNVLDIKKQEPLFSSYFSVFPFASLLADAEGLDPGCGSSLWAELLPRRVGTLHCIDPSEKELSAAKGHMAEQPAARFHRPSSDTIPLADGSQDFGYSLGVLHHIPDTGMALTACAQKLKLSGPSLLYLYYCFDNRPKWFQFLWQCSDLLRQGICRLPFAARKAVTTVIATVVYWPLARTAGVLQRLSRNRSAFSLSSYRACRFFTPRTDALDRFGTRLEQRFTRVEIFQMMANASLRNIVFKEDAIFLTACNRKAT